MVKPYPNCWGLQKSLVNLWDIIGDDLHKRSRIGAVISSHRGDINELISSSLSIGFKKRILVLMKHWYKKRIFEDIRCLEDVEKRHLYSAIMGHQREAYRELHNIIGEK